MGLGTIVALEGAVAIATLPQTFRGKDGWLEFNQRMVENPQNPITIIKWLSYELPHAISYKFNINQVSEKELAEALQNPKTTSKLEELIKKDQENQLSEIGGIVTYIKKENRLEFYPIESANYKHALLLQNALENNNLQILSEFFQENWEEAKIVCTIKQNSLADYLKFRNKKEVSETLKKLAESYISISDFNYLTYQQDYIDFYSQNFLKIEGKFVGYFHLHIGGGGPGSGDFECSRSGRELVFVKTEEKIKLFDLRHLQQYETN